MIKVMLVEDDINDARKVVKLLEPLKEEINLLFYAKNSRDAMSLFNSHKHEIDIVLMDINLGQDLGLNVAFDMKNIKPETIIIMVSNIKEERTVHISYELAATAFVSKQNLHMLPGIIRGVYNNIVGNNKILEDYRRLKQEEIASILTDSEKQLIFAIIKGETEEDFILRTRKDKSTVNTQKRAILKKFEMDTLEEVAEKIKRAGN